MTMTDEDRIRKFRSDIIASCTLLIIFAIGVYFAFFFVLPPHIYIQLYVGGDSIDFSNLDTSIVIDLKFKRSVPFSPPPLRYDNVNIALYCASCNQSFSALGYSVVPGFIQGDENMSYMEAVVVPSGPSWDDARWKIAQGSTVELRVKLTTSFTASEKCRYRRYCTKSTTVVVTADFRLDDSGQVSKIH